ncbi:hydrogenase expression/formation protein HypE [Opitutus terrae]|uniref:Hydrogenase expression/formation protein HypE n=1 Tax=Opitutus terrae (strain DSM 11246 / JCM 15787 / PB90-1) TaxID=452637 RepID=B1ZQ60_OPITP|nr:hydrogenase expression/formation protein HypE [Opitutus terrae PB90-1]
MAHAEITLAHGGGGRLTQQLIERVFGPAFRNPALDARHDGAVLNVPAGVRLAFTTDTHVVKPLFFPGGDIGALAVTGTVNDLAMCGARPRWLSAGFVLEEGLPMETLERVVRSMADAARAANVEIVTGDTKVVERGKGDGVYINTAGIGWIEQPGTIGPAAVRPGDAVVLSGDIGRHGMAILAQREGLAFESPIVSDCAPLWPAVEALLAGGIEVHCLRDLTRGGLATALIEIAESARCGIAIDEAKVAVTEPVRGACELLGLDSFYVANEGRCVAFMPAVQADAAQSLLARTAPGGPVVSIGRVSGGPAGQVTLRSVLGVERVLDRLSGEQLPRIC